MCSLSARLQNARRAQGIEQDSMTEHRTCDLASKTDLANVIREGATVAEELAPDDKTVDVWRQVGTVRAQYCVSERAPAFQRTDRTCERPRSTAEDDLDPHLLAPFLGGQTLLNRVA